MGEASEPRAEGTLEDRPLEALLGEACERGATGTFRFVCGGRAESVTMRAGQIAVVRTNAPSAYLGGILYELGAIDAPTLNETLGVVAKQRRLHGEVLIERGSVNPIQLDDALAEQTCRMAHHLFSLPPETTWAFHEGRDELAGARDQRRPTVDTWRVVWRGLRDHARGPHVGPTLAKLTSTFQLGDATAVRRFGFAPDERALCIKLAAHPTTLARLVAASPLVAERTERLVYLLALAGKLVQHDAETSSPSALGDGGVRDLARRIVAQDPWTTLDVPRGASLEATRAAYLRLARQWHPHRIPSALEDVRAECEVIFTAMADAHKALTERAAPEVSKSPPRLSLVPGVGAMDTFSTSAISTMRDVDLAVQRGDLHEAEALARSLSRGGADGPAARAVLAWCVADAGNATPANLDRALEALDKVITGDPECARAFFYRGQILMRLDRLEPAQRDLRRAARLDPNNVDALREVRLLDLRQKSARPSAAPRRVALRSVPPENDTLDAPPPRPSDGPEGVRSGLRRLLARVAGK